MSVFLLLAAIGLYVGYLVIPVVLGLFAYWRRSSYDLDVQQSLATPLPLGWGHACDEGGPGHLADGAQCPACHVVAPHHQDTVEGAAALQREYVEQRRTYAATIGRPYPMDGGEQSGRGSHPQF